MTANTSVVLAVEFMLPASKGKLPNQKLSHTDDIIQMQHRHRKIERLIGHHRKKTV
jgi:hypothetical protein